MAAPARRPGGPYPNPFDVTLPYSTVMRLALGLGVLPGFGLGLLLIAIEGFQLPLSVAWPQLAEAHGEIQTLGFTVLFIVAVGMQIFPRFLGVPLQHAERIVAGAWLVAAAVLLRLIAQPLDPGVGRGAALIVSALLLPVGVLVAGFAFHRPKQRPGEVPLMARPTDRTWRWWVAVGGTSLGGVLLLRTWLVLQLAAGGVLAPLGLDEALIHLELAGFPTCLIMGVATRVFGRFLLLREHPRLQGLTIWLALAYAAGLVLVVLGWLLDISVLRLVGYGLEVVIVVVWLALVGLYRSPARTSGMPHVTNPTRRWVRFAFGFLVLGLAASAFLAARTLLGAPASTTELSGARHALAQGFMLVMMAAMAARLLPIYSADVLKHRRLIELTVDILLLGAALRVLSELIGGYMSVFGPITSSGGSLGVLGFLLFAWGLWRSLGRLPTVTAPAAAAPAAT